MSPFSNRYFSPLRYPGGKRRIYDFIKELITLNNLGGLTYIEPYMGGAGVALRLLYENVMEKAILNDFDTTIFKFWSIVLYETSDFVKWLSNVEVNIENWFYYRDIYKNWNSHSDFDVACSVFFLNRTNVSGVINGGMIGGFKQVGKYNICSRFNKTELTRRIELVGRLSDRIQLYNLDGVALMEKITQNKNESFSYIDPPYVKKGKGLYMNFLNTEDHEKLAIFLKTYEKSWILSYDDSQIIKDLYSEKENVKYYLSHSTSNKKGVELLFFSQGIEYKNSLKHLEIDCDSHLIN